MECEGGVLKEYNANIESSPGRFYASAFMKMVVAQLLMNYDFALAEPDAKRWFPWRAAKVPRMETKVMFTRRG